MKTFKRRAAQGDLLLTIVDRIPEGFHKVEPKGPHYIVAHSETGHHHVVPVKDADYYLSDGDTMTAYMELHEPSEIQHLRSFDTHETLKLPAGFIQLRRQREYVPEGWRRVED